MALHSCSIMRAWCLLLLTAVAADAVGRRAAGTLSGSLSLFPAAGSNTAGNDEEDDDLGERLGEYRADLMKKDLIIKKKDVKIKELTHKIDKQRLPAEEAGTVVYELGAMNLNHDEVVPAKLKVAEATKTAAAAKDVGEASSKDPSVDKCMNIVRQAGQSMIAEDDKLGTQKDKLVKETSKGGKTKRKAANEKNTATSKKKATTTTNAAPATGGTFDVSEAGISTKYLKEFEQKGRKDRVGLETNAKFVMTDALTEFNKYKNGKKTKEDCSKYLNYDRGRDADTAKDIAKYCTGAGATKVLTKVMWRPLLKPNENGKIPGGHWSCTEDTLRNDIKLENFDDSIFYGAKVMCCDSKKCKTKKRCNKPDSDPCLLL